MRVCSWMRSLHACPLCSPVATPFPFHFSSPRLFICNFRSLASPDYSLKFPMAVTGPSIPAKFNQNRGRQAVSLPPSCGEIHVIVGPMFAGKTTALLRRVQHERDHGRITALIKSNKDVRYGLESIVTHDGAKFPCWSLANLASFRQLLSPAFYDKLDVIGIDEAQFFEDLYEFCREASDYDGKTVIVAGLDGDYLRRSFGSVVDIIPLADSVTKLTARCEVCGKRASFTMRKTVERQTELVGGADVYMAVCREHYMSGQEVKKAMSIVGSQKHQFG